ncbi:MAG: hypothetical protein NTV52_03085, partial [Acidobacteria bacterium]|nr:hypothetical protein [Acidobacteriota bacterium]
TRLDEVKVSGCARNYQAQCFVWVLSWFWQLPQKAAIGRPLDAILNALVGLPMRESLARRMYPVLS